MRSRPLRYFRPCFCRKYVMTLETIAITTRTPNRIRIGKSVDCRQGSSSGAQYDRAAAEFIVVSSAEVERPSNFIRRFLGISACTGRAEPAVPHLLAAMAYLISHHARGTQHSLVEPGVAICFVNLVYSGDGRGLMEPIADNATDSGRALNRRVEVKAVK